MNDGRLDIEDLVGHAAWLRRLARALVRDDDAAADVVQETLVTAWRRPPTVDRDPRPWLAEVARNRAHDDRRSRSRREVREVSAAETVGGASATPEDLVGDLEIHRAVAHAVTALDEPFRQTVVLRFYDGLSAAEIARRLQIPAGTVRWRLKEGLDRVRVALDRRHGGDRGRWVAALLPLLPRPRAATTLWRGVGLGAGVALLLAGAAVVVARAPGPRRGAAVHAVGAFRTAEAPVGTRLPRFSLPAVVTTVATAAPVDPETRLRRLLAAIVASSYESFVEGVGDQMRAVLGRDDVEELANDLGPHLAGGYRAIPLGTLQQGDGKLLVPLWKLELADGSEDVLVKMSIEDGQVTGFLIE
jgi:RNA polymerase sigma-70 factor (ECF subfamily)